MSNIVTAPVKAVLLFLQLTVRASLCSRVCRAGFIFSILSDNLMLGGGAYEQNLNEHGGVGI